MSNGRQLKVDGTAIRKWFNEKNAQKPTKVNGQIATRTTFYKKELNKIVKSLFEIEIEPEWDLDYCLNVLIYEGYLIITDSPKSAVGTIALRGSLSGVNYLSLPTKAVLTAPYLGNWVSWFGKTAEYIYLERDRFGSYYTFNELIRITAEQLASCDCAIAINLMNSRLAYIAEAETKAQAETIKELYDDVSEGNPLVVYRKDAIANQGGGLQVFFGNIKQNYIANDVIDTKRSIINGFLTDIGINNANTDKKERLISSEVDSNNMELDANTRIWRMNLQRGNERVHKTFPDLKFNIDLHFDSRTIDMGRRLAEGVTMLGGGGSDAQGRD